MLLLTELLHRSCSTVVPGKLDELVNVSVCDRNDEVCMSGERDSCGDGKLFHQNIVNKVSAEAQESNIDWYEWKEDSGGFLSKCSCNGTIVDALNALVGKLPHFLWHTFVKNKQSALYESHKQMAQTENDQCVIQMDFAENYTITYQD